MTKPAAHSTATPKRRVLLVLVMPPEQRHLFADREAEMKALCDTAGCEVLGSVAQFPAVPHARCYIGTGKAEEAQQVAARLGAEELVFDVDLSPSQQRNLEEIADRPVTDYSGLILHIFSQNARTHQARLAVELAQLTYNRSRLKRLWTHLDRMKAGMNMRGPGEKQLEVDRRLLDQRILDLQDELKQIEARKERAIAARDDAFKVCLVGYTNAGKSTLMNALTGAGVLAEDRLFATLDTRTSRLDLDHRSNVVLSDTVGFIRNLPHGLIASFHATLSEVREADLLLHVVDASLPSMEEQIQAVDAVLEQIGAKQVPTVLVFNKVDRDHSPTILLAFKRHYPGSVLVSARSGEGMDKLRERILEHIASTRRNLRVRYPVTDGAVDAFLRSRAAVLEERYSETHGELVLNAQARLLAELSDHPELEVEDVVQAPDGSWRKRPAPLKVPGCSS